MTAVCSGLDWAAARAIAASRGDHDSDLLDHCLRIAEAAFMTAVHEARPDHSR